MKEMNNAALARKIKTAARKALAQQALDMVGCSFFHDGQHGEIIDANTTDYREPMVRVRFPGGRIAILKIAEVGSR